LSFGFNIQITIEENDESEEKALENTTEVITQREKQIEMNFGKIDRSKQDKSYPDI